MNVYFPLLGFNKSGGVGMVVNIVNHFAESGYCVSVGVPDYNSKVYYQFGENVEVKIVKTFGCKVLKKLMYFIKQVVVISQWDIVFATSYKTAYYILISKLIFFWRRIRIIYLIQHYEPLSQAKHGNDYNKFTKKFMYYLALLTYRFDFEMIAVSGWIKKMIGNDKVKVIPNGINLDIYNHPNRTFDENKIVVGFNYRNIDWKGSKLYKGVFDKICLLEGIETVVLISDDTNDSYFSSSRCIYPRNQSDVVSFYRECDVFLYLSVIEGFGLPPLEAMACGCVVFLIDSGGVMEFSIDQYNSFLVSESQDDITKKLMLLQNNVFLMKTTSYNAVSTANNFKIERMVNQYLKFLNIS